MVYTKDGFTWTPTSGIKDGLPTIGAIQPSTYTPPGTSAEDVYDVIVVGAGYAGLTAARDLATQGKKTLLVEARDRLGGRTWHATINGFNYEMGGTWIHWHMPHIYHEVSLYGLNNAWAVTQNPGYKEDYCTLTYGEKQRNLTHGEEEAMFGKVWRMFCDMDGDDLKHSWKYAFGTGQSPKLIAEWDKLSCQDRLEQIRDRLSAEEIAMLEGLIIQMGGTSLDKMGLVNALRWWVLGAHAPTGLNDIALHTRLSVGNSELHRRMLAHAKDTGNLSYSFESPVAKVLDSDGVVSVSVRDGGKTFRAKHIIVTVPLNVLADVEFDPPLPAAKIEASRKGSVNLCNKIHADVNREDWVSWSSFASPGNGMVCAFGDHATPAENTHLVGFGPQTGVAGGIPLRDIEQVKKAVLHLLPKEKRDEIVFNRIVSHDWTADEFAKGTWCFLPPNFEQYIDALQVPHGNVHFASADYSEGWRGWIDGAVQVGMEAAHKVIALQRTKQKVQPQANGVAH